MLKAKIGNSWGLVVRICSVVACSTWPSCFEVSQLFIMFAMVLDPMLVSASVETLFLLL